MRRDGARGRKEERKHTGRERKLVKAKRVVQMSYPILK